MSHGSLEQVFIRFAKRQSEETGHIAGMSYEPPSASGGWDGGQEVSDRKWGAGGKSMSQQEEELQWAVLATEQRAPCVCPCPGTGPLRSQCNREAYYASRFQGQSR